LILKKLQPIQGRNIDRCSAALEIAVLEEQMEPEEQNRGYLKRTSSAQNVARLPSERLLSKSKQRQRNGLKRKSYYIMFVKKWKICKNQDFWEGHALHALEKVATFQVLMHDWRVKARLSKIKISELQSQAVQLRNEIELLRHKHAVEQTRWLDSRSRHTGELLSSNSVRSSIGLTDMDLKSLDHEEASFSGAETSNQSANREKAAHPNEDENRNEKNNSESKYMQMVKPRISKTVQNSQICSHKNSIKNASELFEVHSNQQSSSMQLQQKDCVKEQLSEKRSKKKIRDVHSKENFPLQNKHPDREIRKLNQPKRNQGSMGSGKSSTMILGERNYALR
jgi:hypothetical protein